MKRTLYFFASIIMFATYCSEQKVFLVFGGKTGWIGQQLVTLLREQGHTALCAASRLENRQDILKEIADTQPDCIINAAGVTGTPNVDWCEDHKQETIRANIVGALTLADCAFIHNIHCINLGTGCIYEYDEKHPLGSGIGFTEEDTPNFHGSFYSHTKTMLDDLLLNYPNVLNLRFRMPISDDLAPRSMVTKLTRYAKVINIPNSMTILHDLLPLIPEMAERRLTGTYNFVNPGTVSHNEILDLYKQYIDPEFTYANFTVEEQSKVIKAARSNTELDATKLLQEFPHIPVAKKSLEKVFQRMQKNRACK